MRFGEARNRFRAPAQGKGSPRMKTSPAKTELPAQTSTLDVEAVRRATEVLEAVAADRTRMMALPEDDRIALLAAAGKVAAPEHSDERRLAKAVRRQRTREKRAHDKALRDRTEIRALRTQTVFTAPLLPSDAGLEPPADAPKLRKARHCYVCKADYWQVHRFYDAMCWKCGELNYAKRFPTADLRGKVALITGGRVKIGYQASLMLLRAGARVIVTTRFPQDAALRYARETDFETFKERVSIHGLDLRHAPSVELFAEYLVGTEARLDYLLNNAAQTVRRPPGWYGHLLPTEQAPLSTLPAAAQALLDHHQRCLTALGAPTAKADALLPSWRSNDPGLGIHASAALSLVPYDLEQQGEAHLHFPEGKLDADLQQVDLRPTNSWRLKLAEVATAEMLEVHLVNAVAPFVLCGKLKPLMVKDRSAPRQVVNVSAMEGSFSRGTKTDRHPHTNMAKAALNMLTHTSAPDYAEDGIFMNAVDTGWVTDEDPHVHASRKASELDFQPPLDVVDGAARIVDPVFSVANGAEPVFGKFFKDYAETEW